MSAIKDFFKKKKTEAKFKLAEARGSGHRLGDPSTSGSANQKQSSVQDRKHPSQSAQQAGAAALNRFATQEDKTVDFQKARQRAIIKEQARKELENEQKIDKEIAKIKETYGEVEDMEVEAPSVAGGIFYKCPLVGEGLYPREEMKRKIKEFLYSQLEQERGLTAVLIIHTCNSPREKVATCVETLTKYIDNIVNNPTEMKYRKIRKSNKAFQERVANLEGSSDFFDGCGFQSVQQEFGEAGQMEDFWVFPEDGDLDTLATMRDTLKGAEPLTAELDRNLMVLSPGQKIDNSQLPSDFFSLCGEEVRREQEKRGEELEKESMLRTKAMREREETRARRRYKFCLIRVRFPDGWVLQGTFSVQEPVSSVFEFVSDQLETPLPNQLTDSVTGLKLDPEGGTSLLEQGLVPASLLNFSWDPEIMADIVSMGGDIPYLRGELKQ